MPMVSDWITTIVKTIKADQWRYAEVPYIEGLGFQVR
jgi:hypothetical protein